MGYLKIDTCMGHLKIDTCMGHLKKKVLKLDLYDISFIEINSTPEVEVSAVLYSAVLYSADHDEIYQFSQNTYFKKNPRP